MNLLDVTDEPLPALPHRRRDAHKGDFGRLLVVAGSRGMAGAAALCGQSALRGGAGSVTVATAASAQRTVASFSPCLMTVALVEDDDGVIDFANVMDLSAAREQFDAWAIGPGLGRSAGVAELVAQLYREAPRPMVVDADGLNALATALGRNPRLLQQPAGPRILTPHPGEFARLARAANLRDGGDERPQQAAALAAADSTGSTIVILKGAGSVVSDGRRFAVNATGNPGMATAGSGDCLTGVVAAMAGQKLPAWEAARLGVYLHGLAGDLAVRDKGELSLVASDLIDYLPAATLAIASA